MHSLVKIVQWKTATAIWNVCMWDIVTLSGTRSPILTSITNCLSLNVRYFAAGYTNQSYSLEDIGDEDIITYLCSNMVKTPP